MIAIDNKGVDVRAISSADIDEDFGEPIIVTIRSGNSLRIVAQDRNRVSERAYSRRNAAIAVRVLNNFLGQAGMSEKKCQDREAEYHLVG